MSAFFKQSLVVIVIVTTSLFAGCARYERNPVPVSLIPEARLPGMTDIRDSSGKFSVIFQKDMELSLSRVAVNEEMQ